MALLGMDGRWLRMNPTLLDLVDYDEEDLASFTSAELAAELDTERLLQHWRQQDQSVYNMKLFCIDVTALSSIAL